MKGKPDALAIAILQKIGIGNTYQAKMAKELKISPSRLNQRLATLEKRGYLRREVRDVFVAFCLTDLGIKAISEDHRVLPQTLIQANPLTKQKSQRLNQHKWALKFAFRTSQEPTAPAKLLQHEQIAYADAGLLNQDSGTFAWEDIRCMLTPESLVLMCPYDEIRESGYNPYIFKLELASKLFRYALQLEQRLHLELRRTAKGTLEAEIMTSHLANEGDWGAESLPQHKRVITYDENDGKARFGFEFSDGIPEAEGWHEDHDADDMFKWQKFLIALTQHGFDADKAAEGIRQLTLGQEAANALREEDRRLLHETIVTLHDYGQKLNLHLPVLENMLKAQAQQEEKDKQMLNAISLLTKQLESHRPSAIGFWQRLRRRLKSQ